MKNVLLIVILACVGLSACQKASPPFINPPVAAWDLKPIIFVFEAEKGGVFHTATGSTITVPPNALVDEMGKAATGVVNLHFREMHDALDAWQSGIPMSYDTSKNRQTFITAGMFDIKAYQPANVALGDVAQRSEALPPVDVPLRIAPNTTIKVDLASYDASPDFKAYSLDTVARNWVFDKISIPEKNVYKQSQLDSLSLKRKQARLKQVKAKKRFVFNYYALLDVYYGEGVVKHIPDKKIRMKAFGNRKNASVRQKLESYGVSWANVSVYISLKYKGEYTVANTLVWETVGKKQLPNWCFDNRNFKAQPPNIPGDEQAYTAIMGTAYANYSKYTTKDSIFDTQKITNKRTKETKNVKKFVRINEVHRRGIAYTELTAQNDNNEYLLSIAKRDKNGKEDTTHLMIRPVMTIKELLKIQESDIKAQYSNADWQALLAEEQRLKAMADITRSFEIDGFGIYNYDKFSNNPENVSIEALFTTNDAQLDKVMNDAVMIPTGNNAFVTAPKSSWKNLKIVPDSNMRIFALLPNQRVAFYGSEQYAQIDFEQLRKQEKPKMVFLMRTSPVIIDSPAALREMLGLPPAKNADPSPVAANKPLQ